METATQAGDLVMNSDTKKSLRNTCVGTASKSWGKQNFMLK